MFNIADYLKRASGLIDKKDLLTNEIIGVIRKHTTILLKPTEFEIVDYVLKINLSPLQKNVLVIKKEGILKDLKDFGVLDIR